MKPSLKEAVTQLYYWQKNAKADNFHALLFNLFQKADPVNLAKLTRGFPEEAQAFALWNGSEEFGRELFRKYGLIP